jgi:hypothetical protein
VKVVPGVAQSGGCGTGVSTKQITSESSVHITEGQPTQSLAQINRTLSITVFVVKNQAGLDGVTGTDIQNAIALLNQYFIPINLRFEECSVQHIDNYQYDNFSPSQEKDLLALYNELNTINLYLVSSLKDSVGRSICGLTHMPGDIDKHAIIIKKGCLTDVSTLAHQMGHFLNLYHTHEIVLGAEKPDHSNCTTTGDRCCDTDADPNLEGQVDAGCMYTGSAKYGSNFYNPSPKNIMSFSNASCRCAFSRTQYLRMIDAITNPIFSRKNLR